MKALWQRMWEAVGARSERGGSLGGLPTVLSPEKAR